NGSADGSSNDFFLHAARLSFGSLHLYSIAHDGDADVRHGPALNKYATRPAAAICSPGHHDGIWRIPTAAVSPSRLFPVDESIPSGLFLFSPMEGKEGVGMRGKKLRARCGNEETKRIAPEKNFNQK
ncbi:hypothetical protein TcCL_Unassigned06459, partial [Trypanosoma cruzi]